MCRSLPLCDLIRLENTLTSREGHFGWLKWRKIEKTRKSGLTPCCWGATFGQSPRFYFRVWCIIRRRMSCSTQRTKVFFGKTYLRCPKSKKTMKKDIPENWVFRHFGPGRLKVHWITTSPISDCTLITALQNEISGASLRFEIKKWQHEHRKRLKMTTFWCIFHFCSWNAAMEALQKKKSTISPSTFCALSNGQVKNKIWNSWGASHPEKAWCSHGRSLKSLLGEVPGSSLNKLDRGRTEVQAARSGRFNTRPRRPTVDKFKHRFGPKTKSHR